MPLPDERPRQSVANLIGRFEQQGKRQASPVIPAVPRSSSVSSQTAGDAAKEEVKEKREWPPKPLASTGTRPVALTLSSSLSSTSGSAVASSQPVPDPKVDSPTTPIPASPEQAKPPPSKGKVISVGKSTPAKGTWRAAASSAKSRTPAANISSAKPSHPPRASLQSSVSQPLKPQHTGQSVLSNPSTTREARAVPRTAPSTPSRPKPSASQNPAVARPKTPSSGLFAPTAASLARSRNVPPPPPPPVKKVTLSSDAAERLSKPTAASLSKARTLVPSPVRTTKATSASAPSSTSRGSSKSKVARVSVKPNEATGTKEESVPVPASVSSEPSCDSDHLATDHVENGYESGTGVRIGSPEAIQSHSEVVGDATHDPTADEDGHSDLGIHPEQQGGERSVEEEARSQDHVSGDLPEEEPTQVHEQAPLEVHEDSAPESTESPADEVINGEDPKVEHTSGNEIEDLVNLLEGIPPPKPRPQSIVSIPDEDGEIPDEF